MWRWDCNATCIFRSQFCKSFFSPSFKVGSRDLTQVTGLHCKYFCLMILLSSASACLMNQNGQ